MRLENGLLVVEGEVKKIDVVKSKSGDKTTRVTLEFVGPEAESVRELHKYVAVEKTVAITFSVINTNSTGGKE